MTEYELYHHGVKGQKWGIRRTAAQLGHRVAGAAKAAGKAVGKGASKAGRAAKKAAVIKVKQIHAENKEKRYYEKLHKKKLSQMTDNEISDLTKRVKVEASLKDAKYESRVQNARKFYNNVAKQPVNTFFATYSKKAIESMFDDKSGNDNNSNGDSSSSGSKEKQSTTDKVKSAAKEKTKETIDKINSRDAKSKNPPIIRR